MSTPAGAAALVANAFQRAPDGTLIFPPLPGLTWGFKPRPTFSTIVQEGADRSSATIQLDPYPRWEYDLEFGHLSDDPTEGNLPQGATNPLKATAFGQLLGLFLACGGRRDTFMMKVADITKRPADSHITNQIIGTGDGFTKSFQIVRSVAGFLDLIENPVNVVLTIQAPGQRPVVTAPAAIVNGLVTFTNPPAAGSLVNATFDWYYRMRFSKDQDEAQSLWFQMYNHGTLTLVGERNAAA